MPSPWATNNRCGALCTYPELVPFEHSLYFFDPRRSLWVWGKLDLYRYLVMTLTGVTEVTVAVPEYPFNIVQMNADNDNIYCQLSQSIEIGLFIEGFWPWQMWHHRYVRYQGLDENLPYAVSSGSFRPTTYAVQIDKSQRSLCEYMTSHSQGRHLPGRKSCVQILNRGIASFFYQEAARQENVAITSQVSIPGRDGHGSD